MKIASVASRIENLGLTRPYAIAFRAIETVQSAVVGIRTESGRVGLGAASPGPDVTGETLEMCRASLAAKSSAGWSDATCARCRRSAASCDEDASTPAARAAVDMALHDLFAQHLGLPLADVLGRAHFELPTSITIGIRGSRKRSPKPTSIWARLHDSQGQDGQRRRRTSSDSSVCGKRPVPRSAFASMRTRATRARDGAFFEGPNRSAWSSSSSR